MPLTRSMRQTRPHAYLGSLSPTFTWMALLPSTEKLGSESRYNLQASFFVHTSTWMTEPWNVEPFSVAMAVCTSSAELYPALPSPLLPIFTYLQSPACFMCSINSLLRSTLAASAGKPPTHAVFSGSVRRLPLPLPLPQPFSNMGCQAGAQPPLPSPPPHPIAARTAVVPLRICDGTSAPGAQDSSGRHLWARNRLKCHTYRSCVLPCNL
mmetsp:Transcript_152165/g.486226  ORF Transcript_152165/g.486226 Transcript_152165/m.486226 type:complete len:210 (-) Transcript_152165:124-753(-)